MNNFEVIRILSRMLDNTRVISIGSQIHYLKQVLIIDKNSH